MDIQAEVEKNGEFIFDRILDKNYEAIDALLFKIRKDVDHTNDSVLVCIILMSSHVVKELKNWHFLYQTTRVKFIAKYGVDRTNNIFHGV